MSHVPSACSMQERASFMALAIEPPSKNAADAIAAPTMARIRAYSAADAPEISFSILMNFFTIRFLSSNAGHANGVKPHRDDVEERWRCQPRRLSKPENFQALRLPPAKPP